MKDGGCGGAQQLPPFLYLIFRFNCLYWLVCGSLPWFIDRNVGMYRRASCSFMPAPVYAVLTGHISSQLFIFRKAYWHNVSGIFWKPELLEVTECIAIVTRNLQMYPWLTRSWWGGCSTVSPESPEGLGLCTKMRLGKRRVSIDRAVLLCSVLQWNHGSYGTLMSMPLFWWSKWAVKTECRL